MFGPLVVKPAKSKGDKTGAWRVQLRPQFLKKNCTGCKLCVTICAENCIQVKDKDNIICDYNYCKGCGLCVLTCPKGEITMVEEKAKEEDK